MGRKKKYEKPSIVDISGCGVSGDIGVGGQPHNIERGSCIAGSLPMFNCDNGPEFVGSCSGGGTPDTSLCGGGGYHTYPACKEGSNAATLCLSGNAQQ